MCFKTFRYNKMPFLPSFICSYLPLLAFANVGDVMAVSLQNCDTITFYCLGCKFQPLCATTPLAAAATKNQFFKVSYEEAENTNIRGGITVQLTSCLICLDRNALLMMSFTCLV